MKDIRRQTRRQYSAEEKIRMVLEGLRGKENIKPNWHDMKGHAAPFSSGWAKR